MQNRQILLLKLARKILITSRECWHLMTESYTGLGDDGLPPDDPPLGPSLGEILGLVALIITILYIFGISWKVVKIYKGEYVPTEPVYLKYK